MQTAAGEDGRHSERGQGDVIERRRHPVRDGRHEEHQGPGPPSTAAKAGPGKCRDVGCEREPQEPLDPATCHRPSDLERESIEQLGHQWIDAFVQIWQKPDRAFDQECLGHLEMVAQGIAVGYRGDCRNGGRQEDQAGNECDCTAREAK